ncbi:GntR family transcriptional regulator [Acidimangrovimonas sediminis]|uniref:GntR family transcriptional regulator n=1 Tax=Acidimangrovimonas sediminis TaxID=2056283 RepID=UPI000C80369C|nr:GntR family transcriptional regulator [Acidimangrovimonas sediminis]
MQQIGEEQLARRWTRRYDARQPIVSQIHRFLRGEILTLDLAPKQRLSEADLSQQMGVSRTPVREALIRLAEEGLVDILPQRGSFVAPIRLTEVREAQFIRAALECSIAERAAATMSPGLARYLEELLDRQKRAIAAGDRTGFLALDEAFHQALCDHCDLPRAWKILQTVKGQLDRVRYLSLPDSQHLATLLAQHRKITEAIAGGDAAAARQSMQAHLEEVFGSIELLSRERPEIFERDNG